MKYFVLNKPLDYKRGYAQNCIWKDRLLQIADAKENEPGIFISRIFDSREKGMIWHRFIMESQSLGDASIQFSFYASDEEFFWKNGVRTSFETFLNHPDVSIEHKKEWLTPYLVREELNPEDILLHDVNGRYFWFIVTLLGQGTFSPAVGNMRIFFPKQSWMDELPAVYADHSGNDSFLERYLGIFQTIYEDTEEKIRQITKKFDYETTDEEFLKWLASWLDLKNTYVWTKEKLRIFLGSAMELFGMRGTREGMIRLVTLYTGEKPLLLEKFELNEKKKQNACPGVWDRLFGGKEQCFLLIKSECIADRENYKALLHMIEEMKPAYIDVGVILLKPYIFAGNHSYLGVNSVLGQYRPLKLDGLSLLPFTAIQKDTRSKEEET